MDANIKPLALLLTIVITKLPPDHAPPQKDHE